MKVLKIVLAILIPVAVVAAILPLVYPLVSPLPGSEFDFGKIFETLGDVFKDFSRAIELFGFAIVIMLVAPIVGSLLLVLWIVFGIVKKRLIGILFGFIAAIALTFGALGVLVDAVFNAAAVLAEADNTGYVIMQYVELGAIVLFVAAFVVHVIIMFKAAKARKEAKKAAKAAQAESSASYEIDYNDLPPILFEEHKKDSDPELVLHKVEHIEVGPNHVLKGHYVRDDEIEALLASKRFSHEDEIPESILHFLDSKHEAEEKGIDLPMFDPNFVPTREEEELLTEEEKFVLEALRNYQPKGFAEEELPRSVKAEHRSMEEQPVDERIVAFLNSKPVEEPVEDLPIFDPKFVPQKEEVEAPSLSEEELGVVAAMANFEPKKEPAEPQYFGVSDEEYVDLPFFREHEEEPVEFIEEIIRVKDTREEEVDAPKLANSKPVHLSKNKEGKYQLKQVGEEKPFAEFDSEEEAIKFAKGVKRVNGVSVRIHDDEGKIRSL